MTSASLPNVLALHRFIRHMATDPFLHFSLLGAALFVGDYYLEDRVQITDIVIKEEQIRHLKSTYHLKYGTSPTQLQLDALVDNMLREEMFYREALRLGLDEEDEIIRRRLVQKYEFLQQDLAIPEEPTDEKLREYFDQHLHDYQNPRTITFTHSYFSPDSRGELGAQQSAREMASKLNYQDNHDGAALGDPFSGPSNLSSASPEDLKRLFGRSGLAETIFEAKPGQWSTPMRSGFGWHTVYVDSQQPTRQLTFDEAREQVRVDYLEAQRDRRNAAASAKLRQRFKIQRD